MMQTEVVSHSSIRREVKVAFTTEEVTKAFKKKTKAVNEKVTVQGFRPGKAPENVIVGRYGSEIRSEVLQELMENGLRTAMTEHKIIPVGPVEPPTAAEAGTLENGKDFKFSLKFEVRPEITLKSWKGLPVTKAKTQVSAVEIDKEIERFRTVAAQLVPVLIRDFVEEKDYINVDLEASTLAGPVPQLSAKDELLEVAPDLIVPGFQEKILGQKVGDLRSFDIVYPKDGAIAELHDKTVNFRLTVKGIKKLEMPEVDDELAKDAGYASLAAMREALEKSLATVQNLRVRNKMRDQALDALIAANDFEVPESLVKEQATAILREALRRLNAEGMNYDLAQNDVEQLLGTYRPKAERVVRGGLLLAEIAKAEKIEVSEADIEKQLETFAEMAKQDIARVHAAYAEHERKDTLRLQMVDEKVLDLLVDNGAVTDGDVLPAEERQLR